MKLTPGKALDLVADLDAVLDRAGVLTADGHFVHPLPAQVAANATAGIEVVLKAYGLVVPARVDRILNLLESIPTLLLLFGGIQ